MTNLNILLDFFSIVPSLDNSNTKISRLTSSSRNHYKKQIKINFVQKFDSIPSIFNHKLDTLLIIKAEIDNSFQQPFHTARYLFKVYFVTCWLNQTLNDEVILIYVKEIMRVRFLNDRGVCNKVDGAFVKVNTAGHWTSIKRT